MKSSRKTIKVIEIISSPLDGGAETIARTLSQGLVNACKLTIISVYNPRDNHWVKKLNHVTLGKTKTGFAPGIIFKLKKELATIEPDIIHNHSLFTLFYLIPANLLSVRAQIVQTVHNDLDYYYRPALFWICLLKIFKIHVVNLSEKLNPYFLNYKHHSIIANGIELNKFSSIKRQNTAKRIIFIGRIASQKDPIKAIDVFNKLRNYDRSFTLKLIGEGNLSNKVFKKIKSLNGVTFINRRLSTASQFKNSDIFLLTSRYEGMPLTVVEAMASGLVVFMTPVKAAESLVENGKTGFIAPDYSAESIAKLIISATNKPSKLAQVSRNARKFSINFSAEKMTQSYLRLFIKLSK